MSLVLHKEAYRIDTVDLYSVSAAVNGEIVKLGLQCLQTKSDTEIAILMVNILLDKGYASEELTPITWE